MAAAADSLGKAFHRTGVLCFKPFNFGAWAAWALMAFLTGMGGSGPNFNWPGGGGGGPSSPMNDWNDFKTWFLDNMHTILIVGGAILIAVLLILVLFTWLSCRAKFVLMDNITKKHSLIVQPWKHYKLQARSLLFYLMIFGPAFLLGYIVIIGGGIWFAWPDIQAELFGQRALWSLIIGGLALIIMFVVSILIHTTVYMILTRSCIFSRSA